MKDFPGPGGEDVRRPAAQGRHLQVRMLDPSGADERAADRRRLSRARPTSTPSSSRRPARGRPVACPRRPRPRCRVALLVASRGRGDPAAAARRIGQGASRARTSPARPSTATAFDLAALRGQPVHRSTSGDRRASRAGRSSRSSRPSCRAPCRRRARRSSASSPTTRSSRPARSSADIRRDMADRHRSRRGR